VTRGREGRPEDVVDAVLYFARCSPFVTGQVLRVDGGETA
jgi:NAD(P)-dependent dehydrogenase (short-subunit alcohol dehydrogenase family)